MKLLLLFMLVAVALAYQETETTQEKAARILARIFRIDPKESLECVNKSEATLEDLQYMQQDAVLSYTEATDMKSLKKATCAMVCCAQKIGIMVGGAIQLEEIFKFFKKIGVPEDFEIPLRNSVRICKEQVTDTSDECMAFHKFQKCVYKLNLAVLQGK